jgi:hypothetical protein
VRVFLGGSEWTRNTSSTIRNSSTVSTIGNGSTIGNVSSLSLSFRRNPKVWYGIPKMGNHIPILGLGSFRKGKTPMFSILQVWLLDCYYSGVPAVIGMVVVRGPVSRDLKTE